MQLTLIPFALGEPLPQMRDMCGEHSRASTKSPCVHTSDGLHSNGRENVVLWPLLVGSVDIGKRQQRAHYIHAPMMHTAIGRGSTSIPR